MLANERIILKWYKWSKYVPCSWGVIVPDIRKISFLLSSTSLKYNTCVDVWGWAGKREVGVGLKTCGKQGSWYSAWDWCGGRLASLQKGQLSHVRDFFYYYHTCVQVTCICCENALLCCSYFSSREVKNKTRNGDSRDAYFLGTVSLVANSNQNNFWKVR